MDLNTGESLATRILQLGKMSRDGVRAVPAVRFALGVAGIASAGFSILFLARGDGQLAVLVVAVMLVLMVGLLIFSGLVRASRGKSDQPPWMLRPTQLMLWGFVILNVAAPASLFSAWAFGRPCVLASRIGATPPHCSELGTAVDQTTKRSVFDSQYQYAFERDRKDYMVVHNQTDTLANAMKRNIGRNGDPAFWVRFGEIWNENAASLNRRYEGLALCLSRSECVPGRYGETLCANLRYELGNLRYVAEHIERTGAPITVVEAGAVAIIPDHVVNVPELTNLELVAERACEGFRA